MSDDVLHPRTFDVQICRTCPHIHLTGADESGALRVNFVLPPAIARDMALRLLEAADTAERRPRMVPPAKRRPN